MNPKTQQWVGIAIGIGLIIAYSVAMMATGGDARWWWLALAAGIAILVASGRASSRHDDRSQV